MRADEVPEELVQILDRHAGRTHSRTGSVVIALAEILTRYREMMEAEHDRGSGRQGTQPHPADTLVELPGRLGR
jgi:hypothetical protein